jgi:hypothetical protein
MTQPNPVVDLYEQDLDSLIIETAGVPHPHCVIGQGYGSRDCQQKYSVMDLNWKGPWFEEVLSVENGFMDAGGTLMPMVSAQYSSRQADTRYQVVGRIRPRPRPGDYARLWLADESVARVLQVQSVQLYPSGKVSLDLGRRAQDEIDAFNAKKDLENVLLDQYFTECGKSISSSGQITIGDDDVGWGTPFSAGSFTIPAKVNEAVNNCRVTMDVSISLATGIWQSEAVLLVDLDGTLQNGYFNHYILGDTISGIDMTPYITFGTAQTTLKIYCRVRGAWNSPPGAQNITVTFHAWRRTLLS